MRDAFTAKCLVAVLFALVHFVFVVFVVGDEASACADPCADSCAFTAAEEAADDSTTRGGAADDFGFGVVAGVVALLLVPGAVVGLLALGCEGGEGEGGGKSETDEWKGFHGFTFRGRCSRSHFPLSAAGFGLPCASRS